MAQGPNDQSLMEIMIWKEEFFLKIYTADCIKSVLFASGSLCCHSYSTLGWLNKMGWDDPKVRWAGPGR